MQSNEVRASWLMYKYSFFTKSKLDLSSIEVNNKRLQEIDLTPFKQFDAIQYIKNYYSDKENEILQKFEDNFRTLQAAYV